MFQLLLRTLSVERQARTPAALPAYRQALLELPLRLLQQAGADAPLLDVLPELQTAVQAVSLSLSLPQNSAPGWRHLGKMDDVGACPAHAGELPQPGVVMLCRGCLAQGRFVALCGLQREEGRPAWLRVAFPQRPAMWQRDRLRDIARRLGEVLQAFAEQQRLQRSEASAERAVLARELHDSVAQQLGYLQIRASRLQELLDDPQQRDSAALMLDDLRDTLQALQRQVRELIGSARLTMNGRSLRQALEASVAEFSRCSSCVFSLDNRLPGNCLPEHGEVQVLQIVREALANVVRHSHARQVWIRLWPVGDGIAVEVRDNGVGLPRELPGSGHFGLCIMRERATAIAAELSVEALVTGGTRVFLQWGPT